MMRVEHEVNKHGMIHVNGVSVNVLFLLALLLTCLKLGSTHLQAFHRVVRGK